MRKHFLKGTVIATACAAVLVPAFSTAAPPKDQVIGQWEQSSPNDQPNNQFHVNAQSDADGSNAKGQIQIKVKGSNPTALKAEVTCLRVVGNTATITGRFTKATNQGDRVGVILEVVDLGKEPGPDSPDMASNVRAREGQLAAAEATCTAPDLNVATPVKGDIKVRDAQ